MAFYMINKYQNNSAQYIQNRTNWCWAVACRMVGEQFKRNNSDFNFFILPNRKDNIRIAMEAEGVKTNNQDGIRRDVVKWNHGAFWVDFWQQVIVLNANTESPGSDGNYSGDDAAKERGIKFVVTGQCDSSLIQTISLGFFDSQESLLTRYREQIYSVFQRNEYMIGNAILYPKEICHSFVLLDWTSDDRILIYDPWDGYFVFYSVEDVFVNGISTVLGQGIIKWVQYIFFP